MRPGTRQPERGNHGAYAARQQHARLPGQQPTNRMQFKIRLYERLGFSQRSAFLHIKLIHSWLVGYQPFQLISTSRPRHLDSSSWKSRFMGLDNFW